MHRIVTLGVSLAAVGAASVTALAGASPSASVNCVPAGSTQFIGKIVTSGNLIVAPGTNCGLTQGSYVGHDVIVEKGAGFFPGGTKIGHDVLANGALFVELGDPNNGTTQTRVGHDVIIKATAGPVPVGNGICQTKIGHNLTITGSKAKASQWDVGYPDPYGCARNLDPHVYVGHNATFTNNANSFEVGDLRVGHNLDFTHNRGNPEILSGNVSLHACTANKNTHFTGDNNRGPRDRGCNKAGGGGGGGR